KEKKRNKKKEYICLLNCKRPIKHSIIDCFFYFGERRVKQMKVNLGLDSEAAIKEFTRNVSEIISKHLTVDGVKKVPLLSIELDEENGVPKVFYKGEEIKLNREIFFHWETTSSTDVGGLTYVIEHTEPNLVVNRIERRVKGHACD
ncbi:MAG: hypothetical protein IJJ10_07275, partial [Bacillus sp. (in: Bacteria)]|nr:hypothetical protein [Bacillus sp. (in: firmicutes)]